MSNTPIDVLRAVRRCLAGGALRNHRASLQNITSAVADRVLLRAQEGPGTSGDLQRLPRPVCPELLRSRGTGRLAYAARPGAADIVPVNYVLDNDAISIRSGPGPKLQAAERRELVAFEVDDLDDVTHARWSVVVTGRAERLPAADLGEEGPQPTLSGGEGLYR